MRVFIVELGSAGSLSLNDCADLSSLRERLSLPCHRPPSDLGVVHGDVKFDASAGACPTRYRPVINARRYIDVIPRTAVSRSPSVDDMIKMNVHVDNACATSHCPHLRQIAIRFEND